MGENINTDCVSIEKDEENESNLPNFSFHNLTDDPDLLYQFSPDDGDDIDNEYVNQTLMSDLETLQFKWRTECLLCSEHFESYQDLLHHFKNLHKNEFNEYTCTLEDCDDLIPNEQILARHLILRHSDLESTKIYCTCPRCDFRCANFNIFNKHSCYRKLIRKACTLPYCQYCKEEFISHKRFVFHLQFHLANRRPKICLICNANFEEVDEFFTHVNYAHERPETMACTFCDLIFTDFEAYNTHKVLHKFEKKYKCDQCSKSYHTKRVLSQHKIDVHSSVEYKCELCPKICPTFGMLEKHMKWHQPDAEVLVYTCTNCGLIGRDCEIIEAHCKESTTDCFQCDIEEVILVAAFTCQLCSQDFKDKESLQQHRATGVHDDGKVHCPICNKKFKDQKTKRFHTATHRNYKQWLKSLPLKRNYVCDKGDCEESYTELTSLQRHIKRLHELNRCPKCDQKLANADEKKNHTKICQSNALQCQFCDKMCPTKMSLAVHIARGHNNKNILCPHCSRAYRDKELLQKHIDFTHKSAMCTHCALMFSSRRNLETHVRAKHEGQCRFYCSYCDKGFLHRSLRDRHEETIHPNSLYKCGECNFETKYPNSLKIHIAHHLKMQEFQCPHCPRKFGRKNSLNMHIKRHEDDRPFKCFDSVEDGCNAAFITRYLLNQHIKIKHSAQQEQQQQGNIRSTIPKHKQSKKITRSTRIPNKKALTRAKKRELDANNSKVITQVLEKELIHIPVNIMDDENNDTDINGVGNNMDDDYMLLVVDDDAMEMVRNAPEQLILIDTS